MLSLFVPAYNESHTIKKSVERLFEVLNGLEFEVLVVDDNSEDETASIVETMAAERRGLRLVKNTAGPTRRENLAKAMRGCESEAIGFIDADLSPDPQMIPKLLEDLSDYDVAVGSRNLKGSDTSRGFFRNAFNHIANAGIRALFGSKIMDHQCGLKLFRKEALHCLIDELGFDETLTRGWAWDTEMLLVAQKSGLKIMERPLTWRQSAKSSIRITRDYKMILYMVSKIGALK